MKKSLFVIFLFLGNSLLEAQEFNLLKDTIHDQAKTDSMYYMDEQKIIPYKDSGIVIVGYGDSVLTGGNPRWRVVATAFDKNLNVLWSLKFPFLSYRSTIAACTDANYNVYLMHDISTGGNSLAKISTQGNILFDKPVNGIISQGATIIVNALVPYKDYIIIYGNIYGSQTVFYPCVALFNQNGSLHGTKTLPACSSISGAAMYVCAMLAITENNDIAFTHQKDPNDNYTIACYDSSLNKLWDSTLHFTLDYSYNFFSQGNKVVFIDMDDNESDVSFFKYDSKTGAGGTKTVNSYPFYATYGMFVKPTPNRNYLRFGNTSTTGGFDMGIDYFGGKDLLAYALPTSSYSRIRVSDACIIGDYIYTVAVKFVDEYCLSGLYRGQLLISKFNTDFMNGPTGINGDISPEQAIKVYPNPTTDRINISLGSLQSGQIQVYDVMGKLVVEQSFYEDSNPGLNIPEHIEGMVFVRININGKYSVIPIVVN